MALKKFKPKPATARNLELAIAQLYGYRANLICPNISYGAGLHECDVLMLRRSMYAVEFEIKVSKWDLQRDKDKEHGHDSDLIREFYYVITPDLIGASRTYGRKGAGVIVCRKQRDLSYKAEIYKEATVNDKARKWTEEEKYQLARLSSMRIWTLTAKVVKLERELKKWKRR